jgi:serine phosphatase RsbU (regulator of sigma subunit)
MGGGDILLLYSDGLSDHRDPGGSKYFPGRLEAVLRTVKHLPARAIFAAVKADLLAFSPAPEDDVTVVIIKKT